MFKNIYLLVGTATASIIGVGNLITTSHLASTKKDVETKIFCGLLYGGMGIFKANGYALIWPIFIPYALTKVLILPKQYIYLYHQNVIINNNGLMPHFYPWYNWDKRVYGYTELPSKDL